MIQCALYDSVLLNSFFMSFLLWLLGFLWRSQALPPRADCHLWCCAALDAAGLPEAHCRICRICRCTRPKKISKISFSDVKRHRKRHRKWHENDMRMMRLMRINFLSFLFFLHWHINWTTSLIPCEPTFAIEIIWQLDIHCRFIAWTLQRVPKTKKIEDNSTDLPAAIVTWQRLAGADKFPADSNDSV